MQPTTLTINNITFTYPNTPEPLFENIDATFPTGWTAILGDNGIGKTTLTAIIRGSWKPDTGTIAPNPHRMIIGHCPQDTTIAPANLEDFTADWTPEAIAIRNDLKLCDDWPYRYSTLSGGERKRLQIACALASRPDVLILDEPTNHVDAQTRMHIIAAMRRHHGIGIVISHDTALIDATCSRCIILTRRHIGSRNVTVAETYPGGYTQTAAAMAMRNTADESALDAARRETKRLEIVKTQRYATVQRLDSARQSGRHINPKDHDARAALKYGRPTIGAASTRQYTQLDGRLAAARRHAEGLTTAAKRYDGNIWLDIEPSHRREILRLETGRITFDNPTDQPTHNPTSTTHKTSRNVTAADTSAYCQATYANNHIRLMPPDIANAEQSVLIGLMFPTISIGPRDHIAITGPNGTGKSTLLRAMLECATDVPRLVIAQNTTDDDAVRAVQQLHALPSGTRSQVLGAYAQLNADPDRLLAGGRPSPGELRKLLLCLALPERPQLIIMDEPTNHLDLSSKKTLARLLAQYPGALIVVSHDDWFLDLAGLSTNHQ
ncbi:ABC transporter [Bifidobacterium goeldii]|uniref:ABC transporter n=1 Tax=Bifidobacterium goeldii TaxID=2306975 RepID=A0A430FK55_9BIFI|nr:ATP-binding cassette domain-containing protein [Bifidobacterium goeldii]RSX53160.1 ABC transporter [Bifidobacterium goeldii]